MLPVTQPVQRPHQQLHEPVLHAACPTVQPPTLVQVLAGRDPRKIVAAHQAGTPAAAPEDIADDPARLLDAHAAVLAAKKAEHAEQQQAASGKATQLAGGGGIAGDTQVVTKYGMHNAMSSCPQHDMPSTSSKHGACCLRMLLCPCNHHHPASVSSACT